MDQQNPTDAEFLDVYLKFIRSGSDSLFWIYQRMHDLLRKDPDRAWRLTLQLIQAAPDDDAIGSIAAGPLEDLLYARGHLYIDEVERIAAIDSRFRKALQTVAGPFSKQYDTANRLARLGCLIPFEEDKDGERRESYPPYSK